MVDYEPPRRWWASTPAQAADRLVHPDVPGNVAAVTTQERRDARWASPPSLSVLELDLSIERSLSSPLEGRGVHARWDADDGRLRIRTLDPDVDRCAGRGGQHPRSLPDVAVEVVTPDVGGGFGTKAVHPYPEEVLVPWAARLLGREVKWVEDRYEHFVSATHERGQQHHVRVGFDDHGTILGMEVEFWHDTGAYCPTASCS